MQQNIYDNQEFFSQYKQLRENAKGLNQVIEQPAFRSLLPNLANKKILDIGCGFGDFCRFARSQGAAQVIGVDISTKMLDIAKERTNDEAIIYINSSLEDFEHGKEDFDMVISSLTFHYVADIKFIFKKIYSWLKSPGILVFSVENPICTANPDAELCEKNKEAFWMIKNYRDEIQFKQHWLVDNVIKYHRHFSSYINVLIEAGFSINKVLEPMVTNEQIEENPAFAIHKMRPPLLIIKANKGHARNKSDK